MALLVDNFGNVFYVKGVIDQSNSEILERYVLSQFQKKPNVTIDISGVSKIDKYGMHALKSLYKNAVEGEKEFKIIGYGCKEIYDDFLASA